MLLNLWKSSACRTVVFFSFVIMNLPKKMLTFLWVHFVYYWSLNFLVHFSGHLSLHFLSLYKIVECDCHISSNWPSKVSVFPNLVCNALSCASEYGAFLELDRSESPRHYSYVWNNCQVWSIWRFVIEILINVRKMDGGRFTR